MPGLFGIGPWLHVIDAKILRSSSRMKRLGVMQRHRAFFVFGRQGNFDSTCKIITGRSQLVEIRGFEPRGRGFDSRPGYFFAPFI